jgi:hypothetical protein
VSCEWHRCSPVLRWSDQSTVWTGKLRWLRVSYCWALDACVPHLLCPTQHGTLPSPGFMSWGACSGLLVTWKPPGDFRGILSAPLSCRMAGARQAVTSNGPKRVHVFQDRRLLHWFWGQCFSLDS